MNSTKELVQRFLLIGNHRFQSKPADRLTMPIKSIPHALAANDFIERSQWPVNTPASVVPIAGIVCRMPSGSRVPLYKWPMNSLRSNQAARSRSVKSHKWNVTSGQAIAGHRYKSQDGPIPDDTHDKRDQLRAAARPQLQPYGSQIAESDALRHALKTKGVNVETDDRRCVDEETDGDKNQGAPESMDQYLGARLASLPSRSERKYQ